MEHFAQDKSRSLCYFIDSTGLFGLWDFQNGKRTELAQRMSLTLAICVSENDAVYVAGLRTGLAVHRIDPISLEFRMSEDAIFQHTIVTQLESSRRNCREEEECYVSLVIDDRTTCGRFREDIPVTLDFKSDQLFRGCTGLFTLKEYAADSSPSFILVSFVNSTLIFGVSSSGIMEEISEFFGLETSQPTLGIKNMDANSCFIQICPYKIRITKSIKKNLSDKFLAEWIARGSAVFSTAVIHDNVVFALDSVQGSVSILSCRVLRDSASIVLESSFAIESNTSAFTVYASDSKFDKEFTAHYLIATASFDAKECDQWISIYKLAKNSEIWTHSKLFFDSYRISSIVNDLKFWKSPFGVRLLVGTRCGSLYIHQVPENFESNVDQLLLLKSVEIGDRPLQFRCESNELNPESVFLLCGPSFLLMETAFGKFDLQKILPRADHIVYWSSLPSNKTMFQFFAIEHENLLFFSTPLDKIPRFEPWRIGIASSSKFLSIPNESDLILLTSNNNLSQESIHDECIEVQNRITKEILAKELFGPEERVTCGAFLGDSELVVIGLKSGNAGQIRIYSLPCARERTLSRRRGVLASSRSQTISLLILEADAGFPNPVASVNYVGKSSTNSLRFLASSDCDLHFLDFDIEEQVLTFIRTESWRQLFRNIAVFPASNIFAVTGTGGGVDIFSIEDKGTSETIGVSRIGFCEGPYLTDKIVWCSEKSFAATDRRGFVHIFSCYDNSKFNFEMRRTVFLEGHIPCAMAFRSSSNSLIVSTIRGAILEITL